VQKGGLTEIRKGLVFLKNRVKRCFILPINYLRGFDDAGTRKAFCFPTDNGKLVNIAIIVKYLKDHPQQLSMPASTLVSNAFATYFRCRRT
jgi:hypothetical protein